METLTPPQQFKSTVADLTAVPSRRQFTSLTVSESLRWPPAPEPALAPVARDRIRGWKRTLDWLLIVVALPLWLTLMLLMMGWIKAVSPGPIFYRQERVGFGGKSFRIFKFRSMRVNVETAIHERHVASLIESDAPMKKLDAGGDLRLVPMGAIIRAAGLDELPQIFNVLRGEMSLVGPRPCTLQEFRSHQNWQGARTNVRPGLTGYWQVNGKNNTTFSQMMAMDMFYAHNISLGLDLAILLRTGGVVVSQTKSAVLSGALKLRNRYPQSKARQGELFRA